MLRRLFSTLVLSVSVGLLPSISQALSLTEIDGGTFDTLTGDLVGSLSSTYDFRPEIDGGDGVVTSLVFEGAGAAEGNFVYVYQIELYTTPPASVGSIWGMSWDFTAMPVDVVGVGEAFFIGDGSGTLDPLLANWEDGTASFAFVPAITNGSLSHSFGLVSPNAPAETIAQLIDSGALGGSAPVLLNGAIPMPEPTAALVFGLGLLIVGQAVSRSRS